MKTDSKTIYKVNGRTFYNTIDLNEYIYNSNFLVIDKETFEYRGKTVICINVESK